MIKLLIFDLDGTLVDTRHDITNSVNHVLTKYGLPERPLEEVTAAVGFGIENLMIKCAHAAGLPPDFDKSKLFKDFRVHYTKHCCDISSLYPGVLDFFEDFTHLKMAVLSNKPQKLCRIILEHLKIIHHFSWVLGGDSIPAKKPDPSGLELILRRSKISAQEAIMIGDSAPDVQAAQRLRIMAIGIQGGMGLQEPLQTSNPDYLINGFRELAPLIRNILS